MNAISLVIAASVFAGGGGPPKWEAPAGLKCQEQSAQEFLIRKNTFLHTSSGAPTVATPEAKKFFNEKIKPSLLWRTETYGVAACELGKQYGGMLQAQKKTTHPVTDSIAVSTFMGLEVQMHQKVLPALKCVENEIASFCMVPMTMCARYDVKGVCSKKYSEVYHPKTTATLRTYNSYAGGEITNHMFGIAIDLDPDRNPCCGCKGPSLENPRCKWKIPDTDRADIPQCWVNAFKKYGFYWLGEDFMGDTMHFEFLGDPAKIVAPPGKTSLLGESGACHDGKQSPPALIDERYFHL